MNFPKHSYRNLEFAQQQWFIPFERRNDHNTLFAAFDKKRSISFNFRNDVHILKHIIIRIAPLNSKISALPFNTIIRLAVIPSEA